MSRPLSERGGMAGEHNPSAKLTEDQVRNIKRLVQTLNDRDVSDLCGIPRPTVTAIRLGYRWGHIRLEDAK